jgi:membrane protease YdiL (CAAX protease family)
LKIDSSIIFSFYLRTPHSLRATGPFGIRYNNPLWLLVQTAPDHFLMRRPVGFRFVRFAALFYGSLTVTAALWSGLRGFNLRFFGHSAALSVLFGALAALVTVSLGLLAYRLLPVLRQIAEEFAPRLVDGAGRGSLALVSIFSGVGEETFFRGAIQQEFGLVVASLLFGLVHVGPDRRFLVWTVWAVLAGFLFGALYEVTGGLLAPIVAHSAHNAATLLLWKRSRKGLGDAVGS